LISVASRRRDSGSRTGRQQEAVAAEPMIEHDQFSVAREAVMLQAVVADDHVDFAMRSAQRLRGGHAVRANPHRRTGAARDQQWFVAADPRRRHGRNRRRRPHARAVAARHHAGCEPGGAQRFNKRDHGWRLAGPADGHVADHHHRHADSHGLQPAERERGAARGGNCTEDAGQRRERPRERAALLPLAGEAGFETVVECAHG
jgi:hypothetical protein